MDFMSKGLSYFNPVLKSKNIGFDFSAWKKAMDLYEKEEYKKSFLQLLKYGNRNFKKHQVSEHVFKIPHGSVFIDIDFSGDGIKISSDFLDVSDANKVPLYRKVSEINFSGLNLSQITLKGDNLVFEYTCPLNLYEPYKIFDVLCEICYFSDKYDDEFSEKFGAKNIHEAKIVEIPDTKKEKIWKNFKNILEKNTEIIEDLENRRRNYYVWDMISITYKMIDFACTPKGSLSLRISEEVVNLYSRENSIETTIFRGKEFLKELNEMRQEDFYNNIYESEEFIPHKKVAGEEFISEYLKPGYSDAYQEMQSGDLEGAYLIFMHILYNSLYYHIMPHGMEKKIMKDIQTGSNQAITKSNLSGLSNTIFETINLQNVPASGRGFWVLIGMGIMWLISFIFGR